MSIKLDIGCGGKGTKYHDEGFIGIDKHPEPKQQRCEGAKYIHLDFVYDRLPWDENIVDEVICFHVIEHLSREEGIELLKRIKHLLKPGKKAFVSCPDTRLFVEKYLNDDFGFFQRKYPSGKEMWPGGTLLDRLFRSMIDNDPWGHRTPYDFETLMYVAVCAGWDMNKIRMLAKTHKWCKRPDHEVGIILTK